MGEKLADLISRLPRPRAATAIVWLATAIVSIVALTQPAVLRELQRHPLETGHAWLSWRLLTSLLVHDAWLPLAFNLLGLAVVGIEVERRVGSAQWLFIYLTAGLIGELVGVAWQPIGAGNSVASFGLVGALLVIAAKEREGTPLAAAYALQWIVAFAGLALGDARGAVMAALLFAPLNEAMLRANAHTGGLRLPPRGVAAIGLGVALLLCALRDIHGPPLIAGGIIGMMSCPSAPRASQ